MSTALLDRFLGSPQLKRLPDRFESHAEYLRAWEPLFYFETFNAIVNSKRSPEDKGAPSKQYRFRGFLIHSGEDSDFVRARLYDAVPSLANQGSKTRELMDNPIKGVKEGDLLLLDACGELVANGRPIHDVKKFLSPQWLKASLMRPGVMLAYVDEKAKKGSYFLEVFIHKTKSYPLSKLQTKDGYLELQVHIVESLATTIREYKTLRMSEFYGLSDLITNPRHTAVLETEQTPLHKHADKMLAYLREHGGKYNASQREALKEVAGMRQHQFLLIQGPVSRTIL